MKERYPHLYAAAFEAGCLAEREKFQVLKEVCGGDFELLAECYAEGKNPEDALRLRAEKAERTRDQLTAEFQKLQGRKIDPAMVEFTEEEKHKS